MQLPHCVLFYLKCDLVYPNLGKYFLKLVCKNMRTNNLYHSNQNVQKNIQAYSYTYWHRPTRLNSNPATLFLLVHPRFPASCSFLSNSWFSTIPKGFKEFNLLFWAGGTKTKHREKKFCCCADTACVNLDFPDPTITYLGAASISEDFTRCCLRMSRSNWVLQLCLWHSRTVITSSHEHKDCF